MQVAVVIALVLAAVVAVPSSRRTVADWLGFDLARIELRPDLSVPDQPPVISVAPSGAVGAEGSSPGASGLPAPGRSSTVVVDGVTVLVSALGGSFDDGLITKTATGDSSVPRGRRR